MQTQYDIDKMLIYFKINGYVVFEDFTTPQKADRIREEHEQLLDEWLKYEHPESLPGGHIDRLSRYGIQWPWTMPFNDPEIIEHPALMEFLDRLWGTDDYLLSGTACDTSMPGSGYQNWHRDTSLSFDPPYPAQYSPPRVVGARLALLDIDEVNGSTEVAPCTEFLPHPETSSSHFDAVMLKQAGVPTRRVDLKKGSMFVKGPRTLHRGTPNRSSKPRPYPTNTYHTREFVHNRHVELAQPEYNCLSERGKRLLGNCRIVDSVGSSPRPFSDTDPAMGR